MEHKVTQDQRVTIVDPVTLTSGILALKRAASNLPDRFGLFIQLGAGTALVHNEDFWRGPPQLSSHHVTLG